MNLDLNTYYVSIYFNVYLVTSVFSGSRVIEIMDLQEKELKRIYKVPLLVKLGLSEKFLRIMLYTRKIALDIGIMKLSTIIAILAIKLYLGHKRADNRIA